MATIYLQGKIYKFSVLNGNNGFITNFTFKNDLAYFLNNGKFPITRVSIYNDLSIDTSDVHSL